MSDDDALREIVDTLLFSNTKSAEKLRLFDQIMEEHNIDLEAEENWANNLKRQSLCRIVAEHAELAKIDESFVNETREERMQRWQQYRLEKLNRANEEMNDALGNIENILGINAATSPNK